MLNDYKTFFYCLCKHSWWICLLLQLSAWILSGTNVFTGIYYVSSKFFIGKGNLTGLTVFLWIFWFILLYFVPNVKKFLLIFVCAFSMELNTLMFVRALREGISQFYLTDLFYDGIWGCLLFSFGDSILKFVFWQSIYMSGLQILGNIVLIYCFCLPFHSGFTFIKFLKEKLKKDDETITYAVIGEKFFKIICKQLVYICICIQIFFEPVPYLDNKMFLHIYPSGTNETGWFGGIFIFVWIILLSRLSFRKSSILLFLCATGISLFNDYPTDWTFKYPQDEAAVDINYFPVQAVLNDCGNSLLQYCNKGLSMIFDYFFGNIYEPIYSIIFIFIVLCFVLLCVKVLFYIVLSLVSKKA